MNDQVTMRREVSSRPTRTKRVLKVGIVGWRGMVGSVLMQRMIEEGDFGLIEPAFFTTSNVGGEGPEIGGRVARLENGYDFAALEGKDVIVTCQGSDYTTEVYPKLRASGWDGYWIDAAKTLRMQDDAVIILDPVNRPVIDAALDRGVKNYIGAGASGGKTPARRSRVRDSRYRSRSRGHSARRAHADRAHRRAARGQPHSVDRQGSRQWHESRGMEGWRRDE